MENVGKMFEELTEKERTMANSNLLPQYSLMGMGGSSGRTSFEQNFSHHRQEDDLEIQKQNQLLYCDHLTWDGGESIHGMQGEGFNHQQLQSSYRNCNMDVVKSSLSLEAPYPSTDDLLTLLYQPNLSLSFPAAADGAPGSSGFYGPLFHMNLPLQQLPVCREMLHSVPLDQGLPSTLSPSGTFLDVGPNGVFEGTSSEVKKVAKVTKKHYASERDRRLHINDRYEALRNSIPSPTKTDKASIVGDAIEYIKELIRTVRELELLVEKKRCERGKRHRTEGDTAAFVSHEILSDPEHCYNSSLRSSSLQRKSKDTYVDIRIIGDEVTIKLVKRTYNNCFLIVSKVLDELQLDLCDVAGGCVGDYCSILLTTKIYEGSSVYADAIADKFIEVLDRQDVASPNISSY